MKKILLLISMISLLLGGCASKTDDEKSTTTKAATTTTQVLGNLGDQTTTTTTKKVEGAIIIGDNTTTTQATTAISENDVPENSEKIETTTTTQKIEVLQPKGNFSKNDAVIVINSVNIKPGDNFSSIKSTLGKPDEEYSSPSCLYDGDDKTFIYGDVIIYTFPSNGKDLVLEVEVSSVDAVTPKGLKIGLSLEDVQAMYGDGDYDGNSCAYVDENINLYAMFEDNKVVKFGVFID